MNYSVEWLEEAEDELATIWLQAGDPPLVASAQVEIDRLLARDPLGNGQYLSEGLRQIVVKPLTASYSVDGSRRRVEVSWVRYTP